MPDDYGILRASLHAIELSFGRDLQRCRRTVFLNTPAARALVAALLLVGSAVSRTVAAQNLRNVPLGGRTATMGGAGVAAGSDSAVPYLNPGGIAGLSSDILSISATVYGYSQAMVNNYYQPNGLGSAFGNDVRVEEERFDLEQLVITPSTLVYVMQFGAEGAPVVHALGVGLTTVSQDESTSVGSFRARGSQTRLAADTILTSTFEQYLAGPSYAVQFDNRLRLGVSVFASYAVLTEDSHELSVISEIQGGNEFPQTFNSRAQIDAFSVGLTAVAGAQLRAVDDVWVGAAVEAPGVPLMGGGTLVETTDRTFFDQSTGEQVAARTSARGEFKDFKVSRPPRFSAGVAYDNSGTFAAALDAHFYPAWSRFEKGRLDTTDIDIETGFPVAEFRDRFDYAFGTRGVVNVSVGAEYYATEDIALRAGFLSDRDVSTTSTGGVPNSLLDWWTFTLGFGLKSGSVETSYGVAYRYGRGRRATEDIFGPSGGFTTVDYTAHGAMLMLSGDVRTSDAERRHALESEE